MGKIKILHVFYQMNCGGAENFIMNVLRNLNHEIFQFDFIVHNKGKGFFDDEIEKFGGKIYYIPEFKVLNLFSYKKTWNIFFKQHGEYDIVHGHMQSTAAIYLKIAKKYGIKTIAHSHSSSYGKGVKAFLKRFTQSSLKRIPDYKFSCGQDAGKWLFGKNSKFDVIKNGIETDKFKFELSVKKQLIDEFGLDGKFIFGHVGRFCEEKNHSFLIDIFEQIHSKKTNAVLLLIGDGPLKKNIEKKVNSYSLQKSVLFLGIRNDIYRFYSAMDMFLFPSLYEGLPLTLIEAQCSGIPCIVSDKIPLDCAITDLIKFVSLDKSPAEWAEIVNNSLNPDRPSYCSKVFEKGYDIRTAVKDLEEKYLYFSSKVI